MIPGVGETPATLEAGFPGWQTRAALVSAELQGLVKDLRPAVDDFAKFVDGQVRLLPVVDMFNRCQSRHGAAERRKVIQDGGLTTGMQNYQESSSR